MNVIKRLASAVTVAIVICTVASVASWSELLPHPRATTGSKHLSFQLPSQWEQKPGASEYRLRKGKVIARFLAIDEIPVGNESARAEARELGRAFVSRDRIIDAEREKSWRGHGTIDIAWHGHEKNGTAVHGGVRLVMFRALIAAVFWYVPDSEPAAARGEMSNLVENMTVR